MEYCSKECFHLSDRNRIKITCTQCKKEFERTPSQLKKSKLPFCSKPCSAFYYNTHKTEGYRRSKLEMWLEEQLTKLYPVLEINFNKTNIINSELDIYIPSLKLAFELNGIFHYEPIYGKDKLDKTIMMTENFKFVQNLVFLFVLLILIMLNILKKKEIRNFWI